MEGLTATPASSNDTPPAPDGTEYIGYIAIIRAEDPRVPEGAWHLDTDDFQLRATVEEVLDDIDEAVKDDWCLRDQVHVAGLTIIPPPS